MPAMRVPVGAIASFRPPASFCAPLYSFSRPPTSFSAPALTWSRLSAIWVVPVYRLPVCWMALAN